MATVNLYFFAIIGLEYNVLSYFKLVTDVDWNVIICLKYQGHLEVKINGQLEFLTFDIISLGSYVIPHF